MEDKKMNLKVFLLAVIAFVLWLQPWEDPYEKRRDEWDACNSKYNGKCRYIGDKFKTNGFEMYVSKKIHGGR